MRYKVPDSVRIGDCLLLLILITICVYDKIIVQTTWQTDLSISFVLVDINYIWWDYYVRKFWY